MRINRILGGVFIVLSVSVGLAAPLSNVKTLRVSFDNEQKDAIGNKTVFGSIILTEVEAQLPFNGFAVTNDPSTADAELLLTAIESKAPAMVGGSDTIVSYGVRVLSLPDHRLLFSSAGSATKMNPGAAYKLAAKKIVKALASARSK